MSFDNIKLPAGVIASLYTASVYPSESLTKSNSSDNGPVLGNNDKHTTIVVNFPGEAFLPDRHLTFIAKMLQACKMTLADVAIINTAKYDWQYPLLTAQLSPKELILFGVEPGIIGLPLSFPELTVQVYNGCHFLYAPTLDMLNQESEEATPIKKRLWGCLKQLFPIS